MSLFIDNDCKTDDQQQLRNAIVVALLVVVFITAAGVIIFWERQVQPLDLALLFGMYTLNIFGIGLGYHRLFSHAAFQTRAWLRALLAIAACMTFQGTVTSWVSHHRAHHRYADKDGDVHSPNLHGKGFWGKILGLWHVHLGWLNKVNWTPPFPYVSDLLSDRVVQTVDRLYFLWVILSLLIPTIVGGTLTHSWEGALRGFLWGGIIRIVLVHQVTYSVNSICHLWGKRRFATDDQSTNSLLLALISFGEGWHHNHHAFPNSAKAGLMWWEIDLSWLCIMALERLGLVWNVKAPTQKQIELKRS
ncbi:MAG: acyl-CoA desaturase [Kastovskya adunca ATA6-11-RM4]|nr:acyl-CoA desaturase [Kastovskya adunca ATA6-11-RM4]